MNTFNVNKTVQLLLFEFFLKIKPYFFFLDFEPKKRTNKGLNKGLKSKRIRIEKKGVSFIIKYSW